LIDCASGNLYLHALKIRKPDVVPGFL